MEVLEKKMTNASLIILSIFFAVSPIIVVVLIRSSVKTHRQQIIKDLESVFRIPRLPESAIVFPSFEFVKYKYYLGHEDASANRGISKDFALRSWIAGSIPLILLLFVLNFFVLVVIARYGFGIAPSDLAIHKSFRSASDQNESLSVGHIPLWTWAVAASYAGAFLFMVRAFFRAINNFDLSPASFVGASNNIFLGIVVALILSESLGAGISEIVPQAPTVSIVTTIVTSFAIGFFRIEQRETSFLLVSCEILKKKTPQFMQRLKQLR